MKNHLIRRTVVPVKAEPDTTAIHAESAARAWRAMTDVFRASKDRFPAIAASFGLNPGAMHALLSIDPDEPQRMSTLACAWRCDASNVTWLVDRLEEHGLAERRTDPADRRARTVALTTKGARVRSQIEAKLFEAPHTLHTLSTRDLDALSRILEKLSPEPK